MIVLWLSQLSHAGAGPWTLGAGTHSTFVSLDYQQWSSLDGATPETAQTSIGTEVTRTQLGAEISFGLWNGAEMEIGTGVAFGSVARDDAEICTELPLEPCADVFGLTPIAGRLKLRIFDELGGAPATVTLGPLVRFGAHTRPTRIHLTQIGEGQTDLGGFVSIGRTGALGPQWSMAAFLQGEVVARVPVIAIGDRAWPGTQLGALGQLWILPRHAFGVGVDASWVERPNGTAFETTDLEDPDRFSSLAIRRVDVGPKLLLRSVEGVSLILGGAWTVESRNNPADRWTASIGVGWYGSPEPR